jgi:hypothetical protein
VASVDRAAVLGDLLQSLSREDLLELEKKETSHELGEAIKREKKKQVRYRGLLEGREGDQLDIPGTEDDDGDPYEIGTAARKVAACLQDLESRGMTASVSVGGKTTELKGRRRP